MLNGALQGQAAMTARNRLSNWRKSYNDDPLVTSLFMGEAWDGEVLRKLEGTDVLVPLPDLDDYGHRGVGESDVMSPGRGSTELLLTVTDTI